MDDDPVITINDVTAAGHCAKGARRWFEGHGFDFRDFLKRGIRASRLLETGDALARRVVDKKRAG